MFHFFVFQNALVILEWTGTFHNCNSDIDLEQKMMNSSKNCSFLPNQTNTVEMLSFRAI